MDPAKISNSYELVKTLYKNDRGEPFEMTLGQIDIFDCIWKRRHPRNHIMTYTQYGKSDVVAMATLTRASTFAEKWPIVAPSTKKSMIIMGYIIKHIFENPYTRGKFRIDKGESEERIRRERSKVRLTFRVGDRIGEMLTLSADSRRKNEDAGDSLMGFGAPNLIKDESALIPDNIHSKSMRMLGGHKDTCLVEIGNPFRRNHFLRSYENPAYNKMVVDYKQGLREGRITQSFIEEMKKEAFFDILYECKFPDEYGPGNWIIPAKLVENALLVRYQPPFVKRVITCDPSMGGDKAVVYALRNTEIMEEFVFPKGMRDTMRIAGELIVMKRKHGASLIVVDSIGIGQGICDNILKQGHAVLPINSAEKTKMSHLYNLKCEMWWHVGHRFIDSRIALGDPKKFNFDELKKELSSVQYMVDTSGKIKVEKKEDVKIRLGHSPDRADAYVMGVYGLQFAKTTEQIKAQKDPYAYVEPEDEGGFMGG